MPTIVSSQSLKFSPAQVYLSMAGVFLRMVGHASAWDYPSDKEAEVRAGICLIVCMCVCWLCVILYIHVHTRGARDHVCRYVCLSGVWHAHWGLEQWLAS